MYESLDAFLAQRSYSYGTAPRARPADNSIPFRLKLSLFVGLDTEPGAMTKFDTLPVHEDLGHWVRNKVSTFSMMPVALCLIVHPLLSRVGIRLQCRFWRDIRSGFVLWTTLSDDLLSKGGIRIHA